MPKDTNKKQNANKKQEDKNKRHFMKDFKAELKRVIWPTPKQLLNNTIAVITVVLITAAIVFVLDFAFESMNTYGIDKLKEIVDTTDANNTTNTLDANSIISIEDGTSIDNTASDSENNTETEPSNDTNIEENTSEVSNSEE